MTTTLTREALQQHIQQRYKEIDVPGLGRIGVRSCKETVRVRRQLDYDDETAPEYRAWMVIDQLMADPETPLFTADDFEWLANGDSYRLDSIVAVISAFNSEDPDLKNVQGESGELSKN